MNIISCHNAIFSGKAVPGLPPNPRTADLTRHEISLPLQDLPIRPGSCIIRFHWPEGVSKLSWREVQKKKWL
jgi:hypothetical protein